LAQETPIHRYIYTFNYEYHHSGLCKLESRQLFDKEEKDKLLFSNIEINPSISSFIKNRFEILTDSESFSKLLKNIKEMDIRMEGFKAEYMIIDGDYIEYNERREKLKDIGFSIEGIPNFDKPTITYSLCNYNNVWYFGVLTKQDNDFRKHKEKPYSFSNSIDLNIAKTLVSIASKGSINNKLLDACCGVGTILLEGCIADFNIEGCDINSNACNHAKNNLAHYGYSANIHCTDIQELNKKYDSIIIDLPYNLYSYSNETITFNILDSAAKLADRIVIVSISDIKPMIIKSRLEISDFCTVEKRGRSKFARKIWVCEKET